MKWLLDQGLSHWSAGVLRSHGIDAVHVSEIGMWAASDTVILSRADQEGRVIATLDHDFPDELAMSRSRGPSILLIRQDRLIGEDLVELIETLPAEAVAALEQGAVVVIAYGRIRIRPLPIDPKAREE